MRLVKHTGTTNNFLSGTVYHISVLAKMSTKGYDLLSDWQNMSLLKFLHHFALR